MTTVVEIGCGTEAGPFFEGCDTHLAVDIDPLKVERSIKRDPRLTGMVADATKLDEIDDASVDTVLARNVFGDNMLGIETELATDLLSIASEKLQDEIDNAVDERRLAIMQEAGRILVTGGRLAIVEQYTPEVATEFIDKIKAGKLSSPPELGPFTRVDLADVTPLNYFTVQTQNDFGFAHLPIRTWVAERK